MVVSVRHPALPTGAVGLSIPSALVYAGAWLVRLGINLAPRQSLQQGGVREVPVDLGKVGEFVVKAASVLLCSGSYVLCDVSVPSERVRVRITVI